ncbi:MAG: DegT/DnrJ/EryC1/StrS family aminotransferase [Candidatus Treponema excrementipullorum]|uniref:DegT/DnrJ/EryC1/StrS family aminotransferase n=1 Tax=Candidatus Treponema excrementipullorum TaxID=2838768 RepID=A0A9E2L3E3_9SPIR|nr:DegT/DnrJ/EryC1/StrS family aminotransferase [Candidatus Treponema excrementipullorum]
MWKVQLFKLNYDNKEIEAVTEVLESAWITMGQKTRDFEAGFSSLLGHDSKCLAVSNGTAALHLALLALDIKAGDEVITPGLTFIADQNVVTMVGATNVLSDITSRDDWSMAPADIEKKITDKTKAVLVVHYAGFACDMDAICDICKRHNLYLIEDCAHTPGADYKGRPLGTFGDVAAFSFFTNKNLSVGEGGAVVTSDEVLYKKLLGLRSHGMSVPSFDRFKGRAISYDVEIPGLNYRIDEMRAALGLVQLEKLEVANKARQKLVLHYYERLDGQLKINIPFRRFSRGNPNYHIMPILLDDSIDRLHVIESMKEDGIQTSIHYPEIQEFSAYKDTVNPTPIAQYVSKHELTLPLYPTMTIEEVDLVCDALIKGVS